MMNCSGMVLGDWWKPSMTLEIGEGSGQERRGQGPKAGVGAGRAEVVGYPSRVFSRGNNGATGD